MRAFLHYHAIQKHLRSRHLAASQVEVEPRGGRTYPEKQAVLLTIACDLMLLMVAVGAAFLFRALVLMLWPEAGSDGEKSVVEWLVFLVLVGSWLWFLVTDLFQGIQPSQLVPFEYEESVLQHIYLRRLEISLLMVASGTILLCLCLFFISIPLISKLFLASLIALAMIAVRNSIPDGRLSFATASVIFIAAIVAIKITNLVLVSGTNVSLG